MQVSLTDRSLYLKGLMLLIRKDQDIRTEEKDVVLAIGESLGFDKRFCEATIIGLLDNKQLVDEPPRFSNRAIARCFVKDGIRVSLADKRIHEPELDWLRVVVRANGLDETFYEDCLVVVWKAIREGRATGLESYRLEPG